LYTSEDKHHGQRNFSSIDWIFGEFKNFVPTAYLNIKNEHYEESPDDDVAGGRHKPNTGTKG
jgi:hypothetical protein